MIVIDGRWSGRHGIARFANEVVPRLRWPSGTESVRGVPTSPLDVIAPWRLPLAASDVVYSPGFNAGVTRARQVLTLHDLIHLDEPAERSSAKTMYYDLVVKPAVRRSGMVLTVSETSRSRIQEWLGPTSRVRVIDVGNGCSDVFLRQPPIEPPGAGRFLYVGNLKPHKRVHVLFEALARRPDYTLTIVSADREKVDALSNLYDVAGRVQAVSGLTDDELASLYLQHDAALMPSRLEGFGLPALEALAVGRRVGYSATCASVAEIVGDQGAAVAGEDPDEWAAAMDGLIVAGESTAARSAAWRDRYDWGAVAGRIAAAVEPLVD